MGVYIWCELVCAQCSRTRTGRYTSGALPRRALMKDARSAGWVFADDNAFCSPQCRERYRDFDVALKTV